jgi:phenylpyruvate tautomerase PptA (4-oxalocrotonate tautomerase family)
MPIVKTEVPAGTPQGRKALIVEAIHQGLVEAIGMPQDELFNRVSEYQPHDFFYSRSFNGIKRSDAVIMIEISLRRGRSDAMKRDLYQAIVQKLQAATNTDPRDVIIYMHENDYSDWSMGNGKFAMALAQQRGSDS